MLFKHRTGFRSVLLFFAVAITGITLSNILFSCKKNDPGTGNGGADSVFVFPLKVGNIWQYHTINKTYDSTHSLISIYEDNTTWEVMKDTVMIGRTCYKIKFTQGTAANPVRAIVYGYYYQGPAGLYGIASLDGEVHTMLKTNKPLLTNTSFMIFPSTGLGKRKALFFPDSALYLLKYPMKLNDSWESNETIPSFNCMRRYIKYQAITTPAGMFKCYTIHRTDTSDSKDNFTFTFHFGKKGLVQENINVDFGNQSPDQGRFLESQTQLISTNF